jgi:hypothetical protein
MERYCFNIAVILSKRFEFLNQRSRACDTDAGRNTPQPRWHRKAVGRSPRAMRDAGRLKKNPLADKAA